mmetsp:Transcript_82045/g.171739  ORF Transcript_82045/g.171739 Transcript_82045/m.171739 type:complete len:302 (-) Transcript_82045:68-973(-)|eukprot:CAMPEP_0206432938 /NCGR_PEP_ID=MMETSP0324_2-20121206/8243_1 /ASSEMBLY_ACC=CAM_ASM_000836 /TAXON_ID=2866 /ORGANISM="Crypthecodinium cohnii, Strain Seligo" /LENGTH=301 /DNA_ID=CAMNT_0053899123 /DNA_START=92 /DNA_END=997 /DNA_ORIENTATION=-
MPALGGKDIFRRLREEAAATGKTGGGCKGKPMDDASVSYVAVRRGHENQQATLIDGKTQEKEGDQFFFQQEQKVDLEATLSSREVATDVGPIIVLEDPQGAWAAGNGATVWDSALLLSEFLQRELRPCMIPGGTNQANARGLLHPSMRALELGAGTGLVGMVLAKLGMEVVLTERPLALPLLQRNVDENRLSTAQVHALTWGEPFLGAAWAQEPFDVVVGSDLIFPNNSECHALLVETLAAVVRPTTWCWVAYEPREQATDTSFLGLLQRKFDVERLAPDCLPENAPSDLWLLRLHRKLSS